MSHIYPYLNHTPSLGEDVFIAPSAVVVGNVTLGNQTNIWYNATLRGDVHHIKIGNRTNIQDNVVCHVTTDKHPLIIGNSVTIGHSAILHGCEIHDFSLVGMGAKVLDGAVVAERGFVAAGALISPGKVVESGWLWAGVPAKPIRKITSEEQAYLSRSADHYVKVAQNYSQSLPKNRQTQPKHMVR